jgi:hypothetical protein
MKRRTFLTTLGAAAAAIVAPIAYAATHTKEVALHLAEFLAKRKARALFQRFFKTATTFTANPMQMFWFDQYQSGQIHNFTGPRQSGMTTFILVLALFEKKVNGNNIALFPQYHAMHRKCTELVAEMEDRLGKSVRDGQIFWGWDHEKFDKSIRGHKAKGFFMADAGLFPLDTTKRIKSLAAPKGSHYYFGTHQPAGKPKSAYDAGYIYCPYIPLLTLE